MRILFIGEFSRITTGYGRIASELISRFYKDGYEVAELATFCGKGDPRIQTVPWKVYPNLPSNDEENQIYSSNPQNSNGKWKLEEVLMDFQPTHVFGNGDPFFYEYQMHSPFRDNFNWVITAPVDGVPQHNQWIQIFENADGLTTYTEWGKSILESYDLKVDGVTPPIAASEFFPVKIDEINEFKKQLNIDKNRILGTVMRNQPRKLFDKLFEAFAILLNSHPDLLLYCHTTYPDAGWDLAELLVKHNIISKVLFTYKCKSCHQVYSNYFQDLKTICPFCRQITAKMPDGQDTVDNKTLNTIINMFDVYIQLASREGFGIPQIEAAACDVPVISTNYAGMVDVIKNIGAYQIKVDNDYLSYPMNMVEANPSVINVVKTVQKALKENLKGKGIFYNTYKEYYQSWDKTYQVYKNVVDSLEPKSWQPKPIYQIPEYSEELNKLDNENFAKFLMIHVLGKPEFVGSYLMSRIIKDLNSGITFGGICGNYFTESTEQRNYEQFNRKNAYDLCVNKRRYDDYWHSNLREKLERENAKVPVLQ